MNKMNLSSTNVQITPTSSLPVKKPRGIKKLAPLKTKQEVMETHKPIPSATSLDETESTEGKIDAKKSSLLTHVTLISHEGDSFTISVHDIATWAPKSAIKNYASGTFSQEPVVKVGWSSNSLRQLQRWFETGTIIHPQIGTNNGFAFEGKPVQWEEFFGCWLGLTEKQLENMVTLEIPDDRTPEEIEEDEAKAQEDAEWEEINREAKEQEAETRKNQLFVGHLMNGDYDHMPDSWLESAHEKVFWGNFDDL